MSMLRAREILVSPIRSVLRAYNLTEQQWRVLRVLSAESPLSATKLADRTVILLPSLTRIVADMESRGLVKKVKIAKLGRLQIAISEAGIALVATVHPKIFQKQKPIRDRIGERNIRQLLKILHHIEAAARADGKTGARDSKEATALMDRFVIRSR